MGSGTRAVGRVGGHLYDSHHLASEGPKARAFSGVRSGCDDELDARRCVHRSDLTNSLFGSIQAIARVEHDLIDRLPITNAGEHHVVEVEVIGAPDIEDACRQPEHFEDASAGA